MENNSSREKLNELIWNFPNLIFFLLLILPNDEDKILNIYTIPFINYSISWFKVLFITFIWCLIYCIFLFKESQNNSWIGIINNSSFFVLLVYFNFLILQLHLNIFSFLSLLFSFTYFTTFFILKFQIFKLLKYKILLSVFSIILFFASFLFASFFIFNGNSSLFNLSAYYVDFNKIYQSKNQINSTIYLDNRNFQGINLVGCTLNNGVISNCNFDNGVILESKFENCKIINSSFLNVLFKIEDDYLSQPSSFSYSFLGNIHFNSAKLIDCDLSHITTDSLRYLYFDSATVITNAKLTNCNLSYSKGLQLKDIFSLPHNNIFETGLPKDIIVRIIDSVKHGRVNYKYLLEQNTGYRNLIDLNLYN